MTSTTELLSKTPREQRELAIVTRVTECLCRYCDSKAIKQMPVLELINSPLDWLYRYLNVVPIARWRIVIQRGIDFPFELCAKHQEIARGHLERKIAENQVDYATFVERLRNEMYEYERFALDEKMREELEVIKKGKSKKTIPANVTPLRKQG